MSDCAICIEDVCFSYEKEMVLKHLSMEISQNRICFIMGNNGSGKTTLLKNMMGFLVPSQGMFFASPFCRKLQNKNVGCCKMFL